jgi:hypothetical protein
VPEGDIRPISTCPITTTRHIRLFSASVMIRAKNRVLANLTESSDDNHRQYEDGWCYRHDGE